MAHELREHDSMLAVGQRPWHGLGVTLAEPPATGEEALRIAKLDWSVFRDPLFTASGERAVVVGAVSSQNDGQYAAMRREDTNEILGIVGPGYTPYQNSQMAALFNPLIEDGSLDIETCGSLFNGRRVWMLGKLKLDNMVIEPGDEVAKYIMCAHGHDGCFAVRFGYTPTRIVCNNTLRLAVGSEETRAVKVLHTKNVEQSLQMLRDSMVHADEVFEMTAEQYRLLASRGVSRVDLREYARIMVGAVKDDTEWTKGQAEKIGKIIGNAVEGRGNSGRNWWHAYNAFTEYLTWQAGSKLDRRMESAWFGEGAKSSDKALALALEMSA